MPQNILKEVQTRYGAVAESTLSSADAGIKAVAESFGYSADELAAIPAEANMGLSCGNPTAMGSLRRVKRWLIWGVVGGWMYFWRRRRSDQRAGPSVLI